MLDVGIAPGSKVLVYHMVGCPAYIVSDLDDLKPRPSSAKPSTGTCPGRSARPAASSGFSTVALDPREGTGIGGYGPRRTAAKMADHSNRAAAARSPAHSRHPAPHVHAQPPQRPSVALCAVAGRQVAEYDTPFDIPPAGDKVPILGEEIGSFAVEELTMRNLTLFGLLTAVASQRRRYA